MLIDARGASIPKGMTVLGAAVIVRVPVAQCAELASNLLICSDPITNQLTVVEHETADAQAHEPRVDKQAHTHKVHWVPRITRLFAVKRLNDVEHVDQAG